MATTRIEFADTDGWTLLVLSTESQFVIENMTAVPVELAFADAPPAVDSEAYHFLKKNEAITRLAAGNVYARTDYDEAPAAVAVSI